jgi:hypothetical protein
MLHNFDYGYLAIRALDYEIIGSKVANVSVMAVLDKYKNLWSK